MIVDSPPKEDKTLKKLQKQARIKRYLEEERVIVIEWSGRWELRI